MNIHLVTFIYGPDFDLMKLLFCSVKKLKDDRIKSFTVVKDPKFELNTEQKIFLEKFNTKIIDQAPGYTPFPSWTHAMVKVQAYREICNFEYIGDEDFIMDIDSDASFISSDIFNELNENVDFMGTPHSEFVFSGHFQKLWTWCSGVCLFFRKSALKKVINLSGGILEDIRKEMEHEMRVAHTHDVVSSYLMSYVTDKIKHIPTNQMVCDDPTRALLTGKYDGNASIVHLLGNWKNFNGKEVSSKLDIPRVLAEFRSICE